MQSESSNSVKITWLDRRQAIENLRRSVSELAAARPEIETVILFGSLASGDAVPGSDADLLFILSDSDQPFSERIPHYIPSGCGIDVDVFPYTKKELEAMLAAGNRFVREALKQGLELFNRRSG